MYNKPSNQEYPTYYSKYISLVSEDSLTTILFKQLEDTTELLMDISDAQANYRYALGKWTLKEVIGHLIDTERIMSYRLLRISRGDKTPLAGYDDEQYVKEASFHSRSLADLLEEYIAVRGSTITLVRGLSEEFWSRRGFANNSELSVRALAYIIAGHELHHVNIIKEKYLV
ncbi:DinB family protein [Psychrobacillus vulpis]|uniref:DinB family protein n=1 Tax=Psychrobacillus vulpis TaxID=2325572 RepID=A0A544TTA7_9BACI|nr:DinB family protein [Psychrobacillus vulpis]TQR20692.1 DinB family protein [Psychrobacillus vulpis]